MTTNQFNRQPVPDPLAEQALREFLELGMTQTPTPDFQQNAIASGRRLQRRRRLRFAAGAAAASLSVAAIVPWALSGGISNTPLAIDTGVATSPTDLGVTSPPIPPGFWDMRSTRMVQELDSILPKGVSVLDPGSLTADTPEGGPGHGYLTSTLSTEEGVGSINVILTPFAEGPAPEETVDADGNATVFATPAGGENGDVTCPGNLEDATSCTEILDEDGSPIGRRSVSQIGDIVIREVVLRRDGGRIYVAASNTVDDEWGSDSPVTAPAPPLTMAEIEAIVRDDLWVTWRG